jgi:MtrB/PioB family decaheme-associated outer membrane protein
MRNILINVIAAILIVFASIAMAQQEPASGSGATTVTGSIEVGLRLTDTAGDKAQYERYRDTRDGAHSGVGVNVQSKKYVFTLDLQNAGYRDQFYQATYKDKKIDASFYFNSTPLNYSYDTSTPWVESGKGVFTLDKTARTACQNRTPGVLCIPTSYAQAQQTSIYRGLAKPFYITQLREDVGFSLKYSMTKQFAVLTSLKTSGKTGYQPFGMSFAFNNANELPLPMDNRTTDFMAGFEWVRPQAMFSASIDQSWFSNDYNSFLWDNPLRLTDYSNGLTPPNGPYDPSGYSNGNGAATGGMSAWPDNSLTTLTVKGQYKMPRRTVVSATVQVTDMHQNDDLIPWTTNSVINQQVVWNAFPEIKTLPRPTAEARVRSDNAVVTFSSHPFSKLDFNVKWRHNNHANMTRPFEAVEYVRFDAVPEETGSDSFGHSLVRDTLDAAVTYDLTPQTAMKFSYGYDNFNRTGRAHNDMRDNAFRLTLDSLANQYIQFRVGYEYVDRAGRGFSEMVIEEGGAQPGLRFYDEADRVRNRFNGLVTLMPLENLDITASLSWLRDNYGGEGLEFGLLHNSNTAYNFGFNYAPLESVAIGANYGHDSYSAFQKARQANPYPDPQWFDVTRDWMLNNDEMVKNFDAYVDLLRLIKRTDIRLGYSFSDSDNAFKHSGPQIARMTATIGVNGWPTFIPLPNVTNSWHSLTGDLKFHLTEHYGFAVGYRYEKLNMYDYATINIPGTNTPRIDYLGGITTGYGSRPYRGNTATFRIFRSF